LEFCRFSLTDSADNCILLGDGWTVSQIWTKWTKEFFATPDLIPIKLLTNGQEVKEIERDDVPNCCYLKGETKEWLLPS
jgi:hypothetical protein